ncbi:MAG: ABC transporter substrate-binding protein [Bacteroidia bacterium]|nr:ABC transporter substrate-binding protein [Bacteroidia bacterium]
MLRKQSIWVILTTTFWGTIILFGCSSPQSNLLRLSSWVSSPSETELFKATLDDFRRQKPDLAFKYEPIPGNYSEKLQLMLGTRTAPDIFFLKGMTAPSYMSFGILNPLDDLISQSPNFDLDDFYPFALEAFQYEGKQYGLPKDFNPYVLFYNKKLFRDQGIDSFPSNWQELEMMSRQLTLDQDQDGKTDQYGFIVEPSIEMVMPFVYQNGGNFQNPDGSLGITDEPFIEALKFYHGLYKNGIATMAQDQGVAWNGDAFGRGICAMAISSGWLIPFLKDNYPDLEYGILPLPMGKQKATVAFTTAYSMPKATKYENEAWEIVNYLVGKDGMESWTKTGIAMPTRKSVAKANGFHDHPTFKVFMESAEFARPFQVQYSERGFEEVVVALQAIFYTEKEPRKAMEDIEAQIKKYRLVGSK